MVQTGGDGRRGSPIPIFSEVAGYLGGALVLGGSGLLLGLNRDRLGTGGTVATLAGYALALALAAVLIAGGPARVRALRSGGSPVRRRLVGVLLALAAVPAALAAGVGHSYLPWPDASGYTAGVTAVVAGAIAYAILPTVPAVLVMAAGCLVLPVFESFDGLFGEDWVPALMFFGLSLLWALAAALRLLKPKEVVYAVAAVFAIAGPGTISVSGAGWFGPTMVAVALACFAGYWADRAKALLAGGVVATTVAAIEMVANGDARPGPGVLLLTGAALVGLSAFGLRRPSPAPAPTPSADAPPESTPGAPPAAEPSPGAPEATERPPGAPAPVGEGSARAASPRLALSEVAGYAGGALMISGTAMQLERSYQDFTREQTALALLGFTLALVAAAVLVAGGFARVLALRDRRLPVRRRLVATLLALAAAPAAFATGLGLEGYGHGQYSLLGTAATAIVAGALAYAALPAVPAMLAMAAGTPAAAFGIAQATSEFGSGYAVAGPLLGMALLWAAAAAARLLKPPALAYAAAVTFGICAPLTLNWNESAGRVITLLVGLAFFAGYWRERFTVLLAGGVIAAAIAITDGVLDLAGDALSGPAVLLVAGAVLIGLGGLGLWLHSLRARRTGRVEPEP